MLAWPGLVPCRHTPMTWKSTPAMAGERCVVDKVQLTSNDESHHAIKVCVYSRRHATPPGPSGSLPGGAC